MRFSFQLIFIFFPGFRAFVLRLLSHCFFTSVYFLFLTFDIHISVHHKYISKLQPTICNVSWFIYFYIRFTCFRRFLRPSSGAQNSTYNFRYCQPILLLAASVSPTIAAVLVDNTWSCMYSSVLMLMGGGTDWNM